MFAFDKIDMKINTTKPESIIVVKDQTKHNIQANEQIIK